MFYWEKINIKKIAHVHLQNDYILKKKKEELNLA